MFELLNTINIWLSDFLARPWRRLVFALVSGLLLSLSLPAVAKGYFSAFALSAWFGLVPLLILAKSSNKTWRLILEALCFSMAYHLVAFSWLPELHPLTWQGFSLALSLLISSLAWFVPSFFHASLVVPFVLVAKSIYDAKPKRTGSLSYMDIVLLAFIWVLIQYKLQFHLWGYSVLSAPLHLLAYSQHQYLSLIQIVNIVGSVGLEGLILLVNLYLSNFFNVRAAQGSLRISNFNINQPSFSLHNMPQQIYMGLVLAGILLASFAYGGSVIARSAAGMTKQSAEPSLGDCFGTACLAMTPPVSMTNGDNVIARSEATKHSENVTDVTFSRLQPRVQNLQLGSENDWLSFVIAQANLSAEASRGKHLNALDVLRIMKAKTAEAYARYGESKADIVLWPEGAAPLIISDTLPAEFDDMASYADLFVFGTYHLEDSKLYNSNAFVDYAAKRLQFYNKINLVPFGEYTPWTELLPASLKELAKTAIGTGFERGSTKQDVIVTSKGRIGTCVCFELLFPDLVRKQAAKSEILINLNDLSWFKSERAEDAFLAAAKFRAIENAQGLILASNRGISTGIDACGRLVADRLQKARKRSVYNLYGW